MTVSARTRDPIDSHVGQRLRMRRMMAGLSQEKLGNAIGVSFQMVQKYERGDCRVGASRLMKIAQALSVPVAFFFDGFTGGAPVAGLAEEKKGVDAGVFQTKETIDLLKAYYALPEDMRKHVMGIVKSFEKKDGEAA